MYIDIENIVVWVTLEIYSGFYWIYIYIHTYIWIILLYGLFCIGLYWLYMDYIILVDTSGLETIWESNYYKPFVSKAI